MNIFFRLSVLTLLSVQAVLADPPALILQITVDQLRGDLLERYRQELLPGGFRLLLEGGINYRNAHFSHSATETLPGHTVLATGAPPSVHGYIANQRYKRASKRMESDLIDPNFALLGESSLSSPGLSPLALRVPAFADGLILASDGRSKAFAISAKDRAAIPLAGFSGKAFWLSQQGAAFISSSYYFDQLPSWVQDWNASGQEQAFSGTQWTLLRPRSSYQFAGSDKQPWEGRFARLGNSFPHSYHELDAPEFNRSLRFSPAADTLTQSFALTLVEAERLGQRGATDYLSISFSSLDYVGHVYGPASLESEDCLLRLDSLLAELFANLEQKIGLHRCLIVLSADHGVADAPEYAQGKGMPSMRIDPASMVSRKLQQRVSRRLGLTQPAIEYFYPPYAYLDYEALSAADISVERARHVLAEEIRQLPHVALAVTAEELQSCSLPESKLQRQMRLNYDPQRSGDVYVVIEAHSLLMPQDLPLAANHGSPWTYDTFVPLLFGGMDLQPQELDRLVRPMDIPVSLAAYLKIPPPAGATGSVLTELIKRP